MTEEKDGPFSEGARKQPFRLSMGLRKQMILLMGFGPYIIHKLKDYKANSFTACKMKTFSTNFNVKPA